MSVWKGVPVADAELTAGAWTLEKLQTLRVREVALLQQIFKQQSNPVKFIF